MNYRIKRLKTGLTLAFATNATTIASADLTANGILKGIILVAPALEAGHTYTVNLKDVDGNVLYTKGSLVQNTTTQIYLYDTNNTMAIPLSGTVKIELVTSGNQLADRVFSTVLLIEN